MIVRRIHNIRKLTVYAAWFASFFRKIRQISMKAFIVEIIGEISRKIQLISHMCSLIKWSLLLILHVHDMHIMQEQLSQKMIN